MTFMLYNIVTVIIKWVISKRICSFIYLEISRWAKYIWEGENSTRKTNYKTIYSQKGKRRGNLSAYLLWFFFFFKNCFLYLNDLLELFSFLRFSSSYPPRKTKLNCVQCQRNRSNSIWVFSTDWKNLSITLV